MEKIEHILTYWISKKENRAIFAAIMVLFLLLCLVRYLYPIFTFNLEIKEYLKQKYNESFEIRLIEEDRILYGKSDIKGYIYEFYSLKLPDVKGYIFCTKTKNDNVEVCEVPEPEATREVDKTICYYSNYKKLYEEKMKIKEQLESLYSDANKIDWLYENDTVYIEIDISMENSIYDKFYELSARYNSTIDILSGTSVKVKVRYSDCLREIHGNKEKLTNENASKLLW